MSVYPYFSIKNNQDDQKMVRRKFFFKKMYRKHFKKEE